MWWCDTHHFLPISQKVVGRRVTYVYEKYSKYARTSLAHFNRYYKKLLVESELVNPIPKKYNLQCYHLFC